VPFRRGREVSRPIAELVAETRRLDQSEGAREVTLLGQTVNSYRDPLTGAGLATLLDAVGRVPGIWRVRFLTSHPRHVHDDLLLAIRDLPRVCEHLHLPFQSGDDLILKQMRRRYTRDEYRACIAHARALIPDLSVSTDVIVGYPGETEEQFQRTLSLLEEIRFDVVHIQGFSPRPRTTAARQPDDVEPQEKKRRINILLAAQRRIAEEANRRWLGRIVEVLVERADAAEDLGDERGMLAGPLQEVGLRQHGLHPGAVVERDVVLVAAEVREPHLTQQRRLVLEGRIDRLDRDSGRPRDVRDGGLPVALVDEQIARSVDDAPSRLLRLFLAPTRVVLPLDRSHN